MNQIFKTPEKDLSYRSNAIMTLRAFVTGMCVDIDKAETAYQSLSQFVYLLKGEHGEYEAMIERLQNDMKNLAAINPAATKVACLKAEIGLAEENLTTLARNLQKLERILALMPPGGGRRPRRRVRGRKAATRPSPTKMLK